MTKASPQTRPYLGRAVLQVNVACGLKAHACDLNSIARSQVWAVVTTVEPWPGPLWPCSTITGLGTHESQEEHTFLHWPGAPNQRWERKVVLGC